MTDNKMGYKMAYNDQVIRYLILFRVNVCFVLFSDPIDR